MPPGPRALLEGKKLLDQGHYPQAIEKLRTATSLLNTNGLAWNYLGLACHYGGQPVEAEKAYQKALAMDHDLVEVHYNLGCLWLDQSKLEGAKTELTTFTLRQDKSVEGWLKLANAQLLSHDLNAAERCYAQVLRLSPQNAEALTGLGLARLQRGRPVEAAQYFNYTLKQQPDYAPALLNLAIVAQEQLRDRQFALQKYREYLALKPTPENAEPVQGIVRQLERELNPAVPVRTVAANALVPPAVNTNLSNLPKPAPVESARGANPVKSGVVEVARTTSPPKTEPVSSTAAKPEAHGAVTKPAPASTPPPAVNYEAVKLANEPVIKPAQDVTASAATPGPASASAIMVTTSTVPAKGAETKVAKRSLFQRLNPKNLFSSEENSAVQPTALSAQAESSKASEEATPTALPRYSYKALAKPVAGNRAEAQRAFAQGVQAYQTHRLPGALQAYQRATQLDASFFEAYYNLGVAAVEMGNLPLALTAYENALAARPESVDARYNFALLMQRENYLLDAAREFEKILASAPNQSRAHLALGNLYAKELNQPAKARHHYLKVLEADPHHSQAGAIRDWLVAHP
ncbi:MAG TPA: tetratricopeptide repeat protein [Candidatus Sulfotelmatobacter sp.]|nr:tetratricopeptide repeat protein [Candidatus Sulfotelmatobacter sp.]